MKSNLYRLTFLATLLLFSTTLKSQDTPQQQKRAPLTHEMTPEEYLRIDEIGKQFILTDPPTGDITSIAEFDRASGAVISYANEFGIPMSVIREMAKDAVVTTLVPSAQMEATIRNQYEAARINLDNCEFLIIPTNSYWTRDFGPLFVSYGSNEIGIIDFPYNRPRPDDDDAPRSIANALGIEWFGMPVIHTGGNYMTDGYGFASSTTIAYTENPDITNAQVDQHMQNYLGIDDYSVLEDPNNTYIDHIDCWGKYLAPNKVLIRSVPASHPQYDEIEATAAYYANKTSIYGTPYQVYRVNTPQNQPYTNSYILNDKVFVPIMNSQYDAQALQAYRDAMPGYKVFGILGKSDTPWQSTDALHCRVHEMADLGMLYLKHIPHIGNVPVQGSYNFVLHAKPHSGQQVIADSVILYYRINPNALTPYTAINMTNAMGGTSWTANITAPQEGSTVEYYLLVVDQSGRREFQPFIGAADAYNFYVGSQLHAQASITPASLNFTVMKDTSGELPLSISNTGETGLNYNLVLATNVNDTVTYSLANSPVATAYSSNTLTENGWTTFTVSEEADVQNVVISYLWDTDEYYTEGSLWIESPSGTTYQAGSEQLDGNYIVVCPIFAGEPMNGNWKLWIQDSRGDGGHRATNVKVKIIRENPQGNWLSVAGSTGIIPAGSSVDILVTANAQNMAYGNYQGKLTVFSNDPDQPETIIPVNLTVTINTSSAGEVLVADKIEANPNPFTTELKLIFELLQADNLLIEIYNSNGLLVHSSTEVIGKGLQQTTIATGQFTQGVYMIKVTGVNIQKTFKLIKGL